MGLILGVDRFLDMCRTTVNVTGDLVIAALVAGPPGQSIVQLPNQLPDYPMTRLSNSEVGD
jgi:Na+/H+-dicarboxylate symporter